MRDILNCRPATFRERALSTVTFRTLSERLPHPESTKLYGTVEFCDFFFFCFSFVRQFEERVICHPPGLSMQAARACRRAPLLAAASASSLRCHPTSHNLARQLTRGPLLVSSSSFPSHRNVSTSTPLRAAQYTRFEDDPNRPPPPFRRFQTRDVIIYTLGAGSIIYYFIQYRHYPHSS